MVVGSVVGKGQQGCGEGQIGSRVWSRALVVLEEGRRRGHGSADGVEMGWGVLLPASSAAGPEASKQPGEWSLSRDDVRVETDGVLRGESCSEHPGFPPAADPSQGNLLYLGAVEVMVGLVLKDKPRPWCPALGRVLWCCRALVLSILS